MMRLGLISDIHADNDSLHRAIDLLMIHKVDKILCMGDLVEKGQDGDAVIQFLKDWHIPCVRGNHDELALANQDESDSEYNNLTQASLDYLANLPFALDYLWEGQRIQVVHGSPQSNWDYLLPHTPKRTYTNLIKHLDVDVLLCGHTHQPMHHIVKEVHFINPGSVSGDNSRDSHTCAILDLPDFKFQVIPLS